MEITKVEVYKNGSAVACCKENIRYVDVQVEGLPPLTAFSLPVVELERTKIFEHLNGRPLSSFFNGAGLRVFFDDETDLIDPVFYIHGRSETMRGDTVVSAVILARFNCSGEELPKTRELVPQLPKIYKEISKAI